MNTRKRLVFLLMILLSINSLTYFITSIDKNRTSANNGPKIQEPKSITVIEPTDSSYWEVGSSYTIRWTTTSTIELVNIDLYRDNVLVDFIEYHVANDESYSWFIPDNLESSKKYQIEISDFYDPTLKGYSDYFEIHNPSMTPKSITIITPDISSSWQMGDTSIISWSSSGDVNHVSIDLYRDNSLIDFIELHVANDGSYSWFIPDNLESSKKYQIKISDFYEDSVHDFSVYFEIYSAETTDDPVDNSENKFHLNLTLYIVITVVIITIAALILYDRLYRKYE